MPKEQSRFGRFLCWLWKTPTHEDGRTDTATEPMSLDLPNASIIVADEINSLLNRWVVAHKIDIVEVGQIRHLFISYQIALCDEMLEAK